MSLPSPLIASDEWIKPRESSIDVVRLTAGLHRQVWVSGTSIYVDVHIANNSHKTIKRVELQLERDILCYKHVCFAKLLASIPKKLTNTDCRSLHLQWKSQLVRLGFSIAMSVQF